MGSKWVLWVKQFFDSTLKKLKSHVVAESYNQVFGFGFSETFNLVCYNLSNSNHFSCIWMEHEVNCCQQYLSKWLTRKKVYMEQPEGFKNASQSNYIDKLSKSLIA